MKLRLPASLARLQVRNDVTRLPQKPPYRAPDPLINHPNAIKLEDELTFVHRPPPTAPSPLSYTTIPASPLLRGAPSPLAGALPPPVHPEVPPAPRVSDEDLAKIRRLRREDPQTWTRSRLAKEFNCSSQFVMMVSSMSKEKRREVLAQRDKEHEEARSKWGPKKAFEKEARRKRREFW